MLRKTFRNTWKAIILVDNTIKYTSWIVEACDSHNAAYNFIFILSSITRDYVVRMDEIDIQGTAISHRDGNWRCLFTNRYVILESQTHNQYRWSMSSHTKFLYFMRVSVNSGNGTVDTSGTEVNLMIPPTTLNYYLKPKNKSQNW